MVSGSVLGHPPVPPAPGNGSGGDAKSITWIGELGDPQPPYPCAGHNDLDQAVMEQAVTPLLSEIRAPDKPAQVIGLEFTTT